MKTLKLIAPLSALGIGLSVAAHVQATTADKTAVKVSQVTLTAPQAEQPS